jgi:hypothetical protein
MNKNDRKEVVKTAQANGYNWNSDRTKLINRDGGSVRFSETGGSVSVNGSKYNTPSGVKNSSNL